MIIAFSGHRNAIINPDILSAIAAQYPGATWIHGGATGADTVVSEFAVANDIPQKIHRPQYNQHGRGAPFVRNRLMVDTCDLLVAFYDGRETGGTAYTVKYAAQRNRPMRIISVTQHITQSNKA